VPSNLERHIATTVRALRVVAEFCQRYPGARGVTPAEFAARLWRDCRPTRTERARGITRTDQSHSRARAPGRARVAGRVLIGLLREGLVCVDPDLFGRAHYRLSLDGMDYLDDPPWPPIVRRRRRARMTRCYT
jgi:hypothetical protein